MYKLIRSVLFLFNTEAVHHFSMGSLSLACKIGWVKKMIANQFSYRHPTLEKEVFGLKFNNPVGLGAGFDKNALYLNELEALGFGFVEIGTVTPRPQAGNDKPRLFRLPKDKALINRMGFNNDGVEVVAKRLGEWKKGQFTANSLPLTVNQQPAVGGKRLAVNRLIVGGNIGKNKVTPNEDAWKDYEICFNALFDVVDYFVVNVSSPNTPGLRELQEKDALRKILANLQTINQSKENPKPLLLKIAPDLTNEQLDDIISLAIEVKLAGLVATNTTISRDNLNTPYNKVDEIGIMGGLSGKPLQKRSTEVVDYLAKQLKGKVPLIASGGIFTGGDAKEKLAVGASLIQVWTGFVYEGPAIAKRICKDLV